MRPAIKTSRRQQIPARARQQFLRLAAIAFALGTQAAPAISAGEGSFARRAGSDRVDAGENRSAANEIRSNARLDSALDVAHIEVIPLAEDGAFAIEAAGSCCIGPLKPGPHVVRVSHAGSTETQMLRIASDTSDYIGVSLSG